MLRLEDPELLRGRARFVDDVKLPGTLSAAFVRSPFAHAMFRNIDTSVARTMPGVHAIYTLEDLRPHLSSDRTPLGQSVRELVGLSAKSLRENITPFVLARDEVCYVGEAIAVVVAEDRSIAEDAASRVDIDYEALAAVSDCRDAAQPTSVPVHRRIRSNVLAEYTVGYGDCERVFEHADHVFSLSLKQHRGCAHPARGQRSARTFRPGGRQNDHLELNPEPS